MIFKNKVALVTGGSRGIGQGIVEMLAREGAIVYFTYASSSTEKIDAFLRANKNHDITAIRCDANNIQEQRDIIFSQLKSGHDRVNILVNSVGVAQVAPIWEIQIEEAVKTMNINVLSALFLIKEFCKEMQSGDRIINVSSAFANRLPFEGFSLYAMTKHALIGLTKGAARDLGPRGITVNCVLPGSITTDLNPDNSYFSNKILELTANRTQGLLSHVADLAKFLCSEQAQQITGAEFTVDGGFSI